MSDVTQGLLTRLFVNVYLDELRVVVKASMSAFHSTENGQVVQVFPLQLLFEWVNSTIMFVFGSNEQ